MPNLSILYFFAKKPIKIAKTSVFVAKTLVFAVKKYRAAFCGSVQEIR